MFLHNKYTKWYFSIVERAKLSNRNKKNDVYYESHHIIPKCLGGVEEVLLTGKEHFICHLLLCRMTTGSNKHKMINALIKMTYSKSKGQKRYTARSFALVRSWIAEKNSEMFTGKKHTEETKEKMKNVCGKWFRTEKHNERMMGENNPMWGKKGSLNPASRLDVRRKISEGRMGNKNPVHRQTPESKNNMIQKLRNKKWFTDGTTDVFQEICPEGFQRGRSKNRKVK